MPNRKPDYLRRIIKLLLAFAFLMGSRVRNAIVSIVGRKAVPTCVVLYYHAVSADERLRFAWQMDELQRLTTPIAANNQRRLAPGRNYAAVTFDDGVQSVVVNAIPELVKRRIPATIFVVVNFVGATPNWAVYGPEYDDQDRILTLEQLKSLPEDLITVGSHTLSHPWLPSLSEVEAKTELHDSRIKLGEILGREVKVFSFPYGAMNDDLVRWCGEAGYERIFTIVPTHAFTDPREFMSGRVTADPTDWPSEFRLKLLGAYQWLHHFYRWKRMLFPVSAYDKQKKSEQEKNKDLKYARSDAKNS